MGQPCSGQGAAFKGPSNPAPLWKEMCSSPWVIERLIRESGSVWTSHRSMLIEAAGGFLLHFKHKHVLRCRSVLSAVQDERYLSSFGFTDKLILKQGFERISLGCDPRKDQEGSARGRRGRQGSQLEVCATGSVNVVGTWSSVAPRDAGRRSRTQASELVREQGSPAINSCQPVWRAACRVLACAGGGEAPRKPVGAEVGVQVFGPQVWRYSAMVRGHENQSEVGHPCQLPQLMFPVSRCQSQ